MKISLPKYSGWISLLMMVGLSGATAQEKVTCKANVFYHGQELSGRMMFKQVSPDTLRYAFFNELGMSFVEGTITVGSRPSAVGSQIENIAAFLDYKPFKKNLERGLKSFLFDKKTGEIKMPVTNAKSYELTLIYKKGKKFKFQLQLANLK